MRRGWLIVVLLLSVGLNLGLLAQKTQAKRRAALATETRPTPGEGTALAVDPSAQTVATQTVATQTVTEPPPPPTEPAPAKLPEKAPEPTSKPVGKPTPEPTPAEEPEDPSHRRPVPDLLPAGPRPAQVARFIERIADEVGVQGEQRRRFVALQLAFFDQTFELRQRHRRDQVQFRENMMGDDPQREAARRQLAAMAQSQQALEQAFVDHYFASRELLGPEQAQRYRRIIVRLRQMRWDRFEGEARPRQRRDEESQELRRPRRRPPVEEPHR